MTNVKIDIHRIDLEKSKARVQGWKIAETDKKEFLKFLDELALGKVNKGYKVGDRRLMRYIDALKTPFEFFKKPISKLTVKDMEDFERAISSDKILSRKKKPFAHETKVGMRIMIRAYLKWKFKESPNRYHELTDWFDTRVPKRTVEYLSEEEVIKLLRGCKSIEEQFLIAVLFDSGARAEEFHNIRFEDVQMPNQETNYPRITIKSEYSKTEGRTIGLYWKYSGDVFMECIKNRKDMEPVTSTDAIFNKNYESARVFLYRLGMKILKRPVHYHLFRHSSATYYATKLNRQELCYRYGWKFSSDMPDTYISRAGIMEKQLDQKFVNTEKEVVLKKLDAQTMKADLTASELKKLEEEHKETNDLAWQAVREAEKTAKENEQLKEDVKRLKEMVKEAMQLMEKQTK